MTRSPSIAGLLLAVAAGATACHRPPPVVASTPLTLKEGYCWWAVFRTMLPPDSVAVHFVRAFAQLGLRGGTWIQRGDTTWAHADPTPLDDWHGLAYAARVVAYRVGDSTHFRHYVSLAPPARGWPAGNVSVEWRDLAYNPSGDRIGVCGALGRAAQVHGTAPANPDGEEKLDIWTRSAPED